jgi:hypothetical protein
MRALLMGSLIAASIVGGALAQNGAPPAPPPGEGRGPPPSGRGGPLFISPMGEPFRGTPGGPAPHDAWFNGADTNGDGTLDEAEMVADAARFFALLDQRKDGEIDPDDIERYETVLVPEIRVAGTGGGPAAGRRRRGPGGGGGEGGEGRPTREANAKQGAARFGYLDYPEPVTVADRNLNRGVDTVEFRKAAEARFAMLDANGDRKIERSELPKLARGFGGRPRRDGKGERRDIPDAE